MNEFNTNKLIAYLTLISGLMLSVVAEYYSIVGLTAIFSAAVIPIIIMALPLAWAKLLELYGLNKIGKLHHLVLKYICR